ncbi:porin family protein [Myxococcota bacterium]|nr:porin family protein [Myxococcota bacterium]MBU1900059.1 porin family protein [Myxococcota bacterium]
MSLKLKMSFFLIPIVLMGAAHAEGPATKPFPRFGLGTNLSLMGINQIHVPVLINKNLRVEPILGFYSDSTTEDENEESSSNTTLGLGVFYNLYPDKKEETAIYIGPRFNMVMNSTTNKEGGNEMKTSRSDITIGLAAGAEYFFTRAFSLGGEVQFNYVMMGKTDTEVGGNTETSKADSSVMSTTGMGVIRWYFL